MRLSLLGSLSRSPVVFLLDFSRGAIRPVRARLGPAVSAALIATLLSVAPGLVRAQATGSASAPAAGNGSVPFVDGTAVALQALTALGGVPQDAHLQGNLTRSAGGQSQTGSIDLEALGSTRARIIAHLPDGDREQVRGLSGNTPQGVTTDREGSRKAIALHNLWTAPVWFLPQLSILSEAGQPGVQIEDLGTRTQNGGTVRTLRLTRWHDRVQGAAAPFFRQAAQLSATEIDLDAATLLPVAMRWFSHPSANLLVDIPETVEWSDYRKTGNALIPYRLRRSHNGPLQDDIAVTSAALDQGIPAADFTVAVNGN